MSRSKWKGPFLNAIDSKKGQRNHKNFMSRNVEITPKFIGITFQVHNGREYFEVTVTDEMVGHKFGEFAFTRGRFSFKKKKSKK